MGGGSSLPPHFNPKRGETFRLFSSFQDYEGRGKRQLSSDRVPVPAPQTKSGAARRPPPRTGAAGRGGRTATAEQRPRAAPTATAALRGTRAGRARRGRCHAVSERRPARTFFTFHRAGEDRRAPRGEAGRCSPSQLGDEEEGGEEARPDGRPGAASLSGSSGIPPPLGAFRRLRARFAFVPSS